MSVTFERSGRDKAQCAPDPRYPDGIHLDASKGQRGCRVELPYPAPECGIWFVRCEICDMSAVISAAGRADDPRSATLACKLRTSRETPEPEAFDPKDNRYKWPEDRR